MKQNDGERKNEEERKFLFGKRRRVSGFRFVECNNCDNWESDKMLPYFSGS